MRTTLRHPSIVALLLAAAACTASPPDAPRAAAAAQPAASALDRALAGDQRSAADRARDAYRHPRETLEFFGLRDDMTVVELWPGGGWYTAILAPTLRERGTLIAAHFDPAKPGYYARSRAGFDALLASNPALYDRVKVVVLQPPETLDLGPAESADLVLTFRNLHNWMSSGSLEAVLIEVQRVLKPGGTFGVVEHRAAVAADDATVAKTGYVREAYAIAMAERVGLKLIARSEVNANPRDTKDHPEGVWTLPPTLRMGDKDKEKYLAIGESDRMTLRFIKPKGK